jgi:hypothetical protein
MFFFIKPKLAAQVIYFIVNCKQVVPDGKVNTLVVTINTTGCPLSKKKNRYLFILRTTDEVFQEDVERT